ncbi:hypothetical protein F5I97DRAFT_1812660 [Phlebopus sp. FC_14]|nr:hypothetical protein F5I97DRAFT_1812660 [Phlebopus sp. FC_14]
MAAAFFYGTLIHPEILKRVIGNAGSHLSICPALLLDHTRHQITASNCDYPGVVPYSQSRVMFDRELSLEERSVRGVLVIGLSDEDVRLLDIFEGNEYTRELVSVHPLGPFLQLNDMPPVEMDSLVPATLPPIPPPNELAEPREANTYIWCCPLTQLRPSLWTFEDFVKHSAWKWVGTGSDGNKDYAEVDRRRAMDGIIVQS